MRTVTSLVFKGGGVLGTAYAGAYRALQEVRLAGYDVIASPPVRGDAITVYGKVTDVLGTSAGAIFSTLVAIGHNADSVESIMAGIHFADFLDLSWDAMAHGGLANGNFFLQWMNDRVNDRFKWGGWAVNSRERKKAWWPKGEPIPNENWPTFADLHNASDENGKYKARKDLHVFAQRVNNGQIVEFSYLTTPDVPIAYAVRASMSIPLVFDPWKFVDADLAKAYPGLFVDGGVAYNYPISALDAGGQLHDALGFYLNDASARPQSFWRLLVHGIEAYVVHKFGAEGSEWWIPAVEHILDTLEDYSDANLLKPGMGRENLKEKLRRVVPPNLLPAEASGTALEVAAARDRVLNAAAAVVDLMLPLLDHRGRPDNSLLTKDEVMHFARGVREIMTHAGVASVGGWLGSIDEILSWLYDTLYPFVGPMGSLVNAPANIVFQRDAGRTIFVNNLGYGFADFWLPDCHKRRLIASGYNCTRAYLDLIMHS